MSQVHEDNVLDIFDPKQGDKLQFAEALGGGVKDGVKIANTIMQAAAWIFFAFSRPVVLVTQVLLRKDLGERYFTVAQAALSILLILAAINAPIWIAKLDRGSSPSGYYDNYGNYYSRPVPSSPLISTANTVIGVLWIIGFAVASLWHFFVVAPRLRDELWHSRCDGVPRLAFQNILVELVVLLILACIFLWTHVYGIGTLLALSFVLTAAADIHARKALYNHILDARDSKIDSEFLGKAIEDNLARAEAHGVNASLPAHVSMAYRRKLAEYFKKPATD